MKDSLPKEPIPINPDGSKRSFFRINFRGTSAIKILPAPGDIGLKEADSFFHIGTHLFNKGIPVPEIYHYEKETGILVVEDFGDENLQEHISRARDENYSLSIYKDILTILLIMQIKGKEGFKDNWAFQSPFYDSNLVREKEIMYFFNAFVKGFLGQKGFQKAINELFELSKRVDTFRAIGFLHRDFQSRNIMVRDGKIGIIDFQGGRLGPLGYDLASLLYDPYVSFSEKKREKLLDYYIGLLKRNNLNEFAKEIQENFYVLSIFRLLQALGAYGFLTKVEARPFFLHYIKPAFFRLKYLVKNCSRKLGLFETRVYLEKISKLVESIPG